MNVVLTFVLLVWHGDAQSGVFWTPHATELTSSEPFTFSETHSDHAASVYHVPLQASGLPRRSHQMIVTSCTSHILSTASRGYCS